MDLTNEQIEKEFERQVRLCSGIGKDKMYEIIEKQFPRSHKWRFYMNGSFCEDCGSQIGDRRSTLGCEGRS